MTFKGSVDLDFSLKGMTSLVTGGASGIGKAIAEAFARKGSNLVLVDMNESARDVARDLEGREVRIVSIVQQLNDQGSVLKIVGEALRQFQRINVLVNNAGTSHVATALDFPEAEWDRILNLNLKIPFLLSQVLGRHMIENGGGKIINIASQAALVAIDSHLGYAASKAGLLSLTRNMALEWGPLGVNVNAISPTVTMTELAKLYWSGERAEAMIGKIPLRRFAQPEEIAAAAVFLASDASNMISGENLVIDGGYTIQ